MKCVVLLFPLGKSKAYISWVFVQVLKDFCISFFSCFIQNTKDNPPCNTLFIGNLGENVNEEELRGLLSVYASLIFAQFFKSFYHVYK